MNLDDFSYEENGRRYINPQVALDEENAFIQNLRDTQAQDNAKIYQDTHNLGTDVSSNLGGLNGGEAYFNARYQTPQTNYTIANLKEAAQAKALSDALNNEVAKAKKRYNDAYRAANSGGGSGGGNNGGGSDGDDNASNPNHENASDPSKSNPKAVDTVESRKSPENSSVNSATEAANNYNQMVGGGKLPMGYQSKIAYFVTPDGAKYMVKTAKSPTGDKIWYAPTSLGKNAGVLSFDDQRAFTSHLAKLRNQAGGGGLQLQNGRGVDWVVWSSWF